MRTSIWPIRYVVQLAFFFLFNVILLNFLLPTFHLHSYTLPLPVLVSINSPWTASVGALDLIQISLRDAVLPISVLASIFITGALVGRIFCGWACPIGFIQDLIINARGVIPHVARTTDNSAKKVKFLYLFLGLLISASLALSIYLHAGQDYSQALGIFADGPLMILSPAGTLFGTIPTLVYLIQNSLITAFSVLPIARLIILGIFFVGAYKIPWFWCRYLCPMGALMGIFARFSLLGLKRIPVKCQKCPHCVRACPTQVPILEYPFEKFSDQECVMCLECVQACTNQAIAPKFP